MNKFLLVIRPENSKESNMLYVEAIRKFGGEEVIVYDNDSWDIALDRLNDVSGILLPGGNDVGKLDYLLIEFALKKKIKLLGICQGMQSMAMYGSSDKLISIGNSSHYLKDRYCHKVELEKDSILYKLGKKNIFNVNSYHYQTVVDSYMFDITGRSDDGLIEVIENKNSTFQVGVQWHPERMLDYDELAYMLIKMFITK